MHLLTAIVTLMAAVLQLCQVILLGMGVYDGYKKWRAGGEHWGWWLGDGIAFVGTVAFTTVVLIGVKSAWTLIPLFAVTELTLVGLSAGTFRWGQKWAWLLYSGFTVLFLGFAAGLAEYRVNPGDLPLQVFAIAGTVVGAALAVIAAAMPVEKA